MTKSKKPAAKPSPAKGCAHASPSKKASGGKATPPPKAKGPLLRAKPVAPEALAPKSPTASAANLGGAGLQKWGPRKWPKGGPTKADLRRYREKLLEMRRTLLTSSRELASEALKSSGQDFSVDHMADHGSDNYEQDFSLKLLEGEAEQLTDIREALMKIDGKAELPFGLCEACAEEAQARCGTCPWIPASRLEVVPHARLCVQTKEIEERRRP